MAPGTNGRVLFNSIPEGEILFSFFLIHATTTLTLSISSGYPVPGKTTVYDTSQTIDPNTIPLEGGFLVKTLELSIDPYMRGRMRAPEIKSYAPAFVIGEP